MAFIYDLTDTWNNAGISFNGIKLNVTDTASAVTSKLVDLQIGGVSKFSVSKTGAVTAAGNIHSTSGGFTFPDGTTQITRAVTNVTATDGSIAITGTTDINLSVVSAPKSYAVITPVRNNSGATLTKGTAVYINGAVGQNPTVTKAIASGDATSAQTLGLITDDILNNATGNVILIGTLYNVNTSAYVDGQQLYLSPTTAGTLTTTKPYAPDHLVYMAVVEHAHPSQGKLFVKVQNGYEMEELHDVSARNPINGQTLVYNSATTLWEKNTVSLTAGVNGILPIANGGTNATTAADALTNLGAYPASNPSGYITSSALSPYLTSATAATTYQPLDGDLTAIAALSEAAGIVRKTAANTYTLDTSSYITGITSSDVTTALGFTPYNATNPAGYTTNVGTVTSVGITAGTGVSVSGGPITSAGAITVTNTAPDQIVSITGAGTATVTGTYPNFTITATGGSGTVSSVAASGGTTGLTFTGSPITTSGTLTLGGTLATANGGTNLTSYTTGDLVYASATNTLAKLPVGTSGYVLTTNGTVPSWGLVSLTNGVTGTLPVSRGGTGNASWTIGSLITFSSTTNSTEVVPGTSGYPLISNGTGTLPTYSQINITNATTGTLTTARGGTNLTSYTTGDLLYASATNTLSKLPIGASGSVLTSDGVNISWQAGGGGGGGVTSFRTTMSGLTPSTATTGAVTLAGTLGIANGGTGATTKAAAFNALSPITTTGDLIIGNGSNSNTRLPIGAFGRYLFSNGSTASWQPISVSASDISGTLQPYQGGTGTSSTPSNGQLLIGNGGGYSVANLTAGANITITNSFGGITIAASGGAPSGPYIAQIQFSDGMNFYNNGPTSPQQSPVVYWDAGMNVGSIWFYSPSGGYNASGGSIASITIQDNTGAYTSYNQGTDFSTFVNNWYANGFVVGIYGLSIVNSALRTLMANTAAQLGTPAIAPRSNNSFGPQSAVDASVSGGINFSYQSNGPIILYRGPAPGQYYLSFRSGNPTGDFGLSLNYLQFTDSTGAINTYYNNMDFYNYGASNDPNQHFYCEISGVSNPNLQALLDNTVIV